jgi:hypothetical protein
MKINVLKFHISPCSHDSFSLAVRLLHRSAWPAALLAVFAAFQAPPVEAQTTTTLTLSSSSVTSGTAVTLTAAVSTMATPEVSRKLSAESRKLVHKMSSGTPVMLGTVNFCDSAETYCLNAPGLIGTAQLTSAETATLMFVPGIGSHTYYAVFKASNLNTTSTSPTQTLTVTGLYPTTTAISSSGSVGNYTLTGTVVGTGSVSLWPTGIVSFLDTSNSNASLGSATLGMPTLAQSFAPQFTYSPGGGPGIVAVGDFNGDGIPDLAVPHRAGNSVSVYLGTGAGTFGTQVSYATGVSPGGIAAGDFNGDGNLDLVVANYIDGTVGILLGNGDGTFQTQITFPTGEEPTNVTVGDFNNDGNLDLAVTNEGDDTVSILLGNGDGTFQTQVTYPTGISPVGVVVGDFNGDGSLDLAVVSSADNIVSVLLGNGDGTFQARVAYSAGIAPSWVAVGDFNGDGIPDMAVTNVVDNTVSIFLGIGDGTFPAPVTYPVGVNPYGVAVADFNGDGIADLAVANSNDNTISILPGNGDGTFGTQVTYAVGTYPFGVTAGDFNGDGNTDLVVANANSASISILLNNVTQTETAVISSVSILGSSGAHLVDASYPGDPKFSLSLSGTTSLSGTPIATATVLTAAPGSSTYGQSVTLMATISPFSLGGFATDGDTVTFLNGATAIGTGTLTGGVATLTLTTLPAGTDSLTAVYAGDANFLTSTSPALSYSVTAVIGASTITLALSSSSVSSGTVVTLTAAVSNGSPVTMGTVNFCNFAETCLNSPGLMGTAQLTSAGTATYSFIPAIGSHIYYAVFQGTAANKAATSSQETLTVTGLYPTTTAISSSGLPGSYTLTGTVVSLGSLTAPRKGIVSFLDTSNSNYPLGTAPLVGAALAQTFATPLAYAVGSSPSGMVEGDFNGDGIPDLASANNNGNNVSILLGTGGGAFAAAVNYPAGNDPFDLAVGDFNGDGKLDLAVVNFQDGTVSILLGNGDGTFQPQVTYATGLFPYAVAVGDFNGDGNLDLVVTNGAYDTVGILLGNGDGTFQAQVTYATGTQPFGVVVGDFNGDGKLDLAVTNINDNTVSILLGNGDGTFQAQIAYAVGANPRSVALGDFNGDGKLDLAVVNQNDNTVSILLGNGDGSFRTQVTYPVGTGAVGAAVGDFNGDGIPDLAVSNVNDDTVSILPGNGDGTFGAQITYATGLAPDGVVAGDFNGDGNTDLAVANTDPSTVSIFLNRVTETETAVISGVSVPGAATVHLVDAGYPGDANFSPSVSGTTPLTGTPIATTTVLTAAPAPSTYGQWVILTATLSPFEKDGYVTSNEWVTFKNGATTLGSGSLTAGVATLTLYHTLPVGIHSITATYAGDGNFLTSTSSPLNLVVTKATPAITWATPAAITFGTTLSGTQLNATANLPGTFVYTPGAGATPAAGSDLLSVTFTPTNTVDYTTATADVTLMVTANVSQITPAITWATPAAVTTGTTLSSTQLNASASVAGTVVDGTYLYTPAAGTIPANGSDTLTVIFTPADSVDYTTATASVVLTVGDYFSLKLNGSPTQTVQQGASATYSLTVAPVGFPTLPAKVTFTVAGVPPGATTTFSPATIPDGSSTTEVAMTIHTSSQNAANTESSQGSQGPAVPVMLLLPMLGILGMRKRLGKMRQFRAAMVVGVLSLGAIMGLAGCGGVCILAPKPASAIYKVVVTAHCGTMHHSVDATLKVEN